MKTSRIGCCLLLVVLSRCVLAQTPTGIKGTVTDITGAIISDAKVIIRYHDICRDQNEEIPDRSITTNKAGEFAVNLQSGIYDVVVMANAFEPIAETVRIGPGEQLVFAPKLKISAYATLRCERMAQQAPIAPSTSSIPNQAPDKKKK